MYFIALFFIILASLELAAESVLDLSVVLQSYGIEAPARKEFIDDAGRRLRTSSAVPCPVVTGRAVETTKSRWFLAATDPGRHTTRCVCVPADLPSRHT